MSFNTSLDEIFIKNWVDYLKTEARRGGIYI